MKTYLRGYEITDGAMLSAIDAWSSSPSGKRDRGRFVESMGGRESAAKSLAGEIRSRSVSVPPIRYRDRADPANGKVRTIGVQSAKQQVLDYACVEALKPFFKAKIGYYQCASLPGKGQHFVRRKVRRWVRERGSRYFVKLDVRKCYQRTDAHRLLDMLGRYIASEDVMYLARFLVSTYGGGLNIGSHLSMMLETWYLSNLYHFIEDGLFKERRGTRKRLAAHFLMYMDDILLIGPDKRDLKMAARMVERYACEELRHEIKPWKVCKVGCDPVDICGFVMRPERTTIRSGTFKRAKRAFARMRRRPCLKRARRCCSYWGFLKHTDSDGFIAKNGIMVPLGMARAAVRRASCAR